MPTGGLAMQVTEIKITKMEANIITMVSEAIVIKMVTTNMEIQGRIKIEVMVIHREVKEDLSLKDLLDLVE